MFPASEGVAVPGAFPASEGAAAPGGVPAAAASRQRSTVSRMSPAKTSDR